MEFFQTYKDQIIYIIVILATIVVLHIITNFLYKRLSLRTKEVFREESTNTLHLVKRILNALWIVLGLIAGFYVLTPEDSYN